MLSKKLFVALMSAGIALTACDNMTKQDAGVVTGAVVGGLLGNQVGGGSGRVLATVAGAAVGGYLGGEIGSTMDQMDRMRLSNTLESTKTNHSSSWSNPDSGNRYVVTPVKTYVRNSQPCREFTTKVHVGGKVQEMYGTACRQGDGSWKIQ